MEIHDTMNKDGIRCHLLTGDHGVESSAEMWIGQERVFVPSAKHVSCTIEMIDMERRYDVAIVDEIQVPTSNPSWMKE